MAGSLYLFGGKLLVAPGGKLAAGARCCCCAVASDDFDDGIISPYWLTSAAPPPVEADGVLTLTGGAYAIHTAWPFGAGFTGYRATATLSPTSAITEYPSIFLVVAWFDEDNYLFAQIDSNPQGCGLLTLGQVAGGSLSLFPGQAGFALATGQSVTLTVCMEEQGGGYGYGYGGGWKLKAYVTGATQILAWAEKDVEDGTGFSGLRAQQGTWLCDDFRLDRIGPGCPGCQHDCHLWHDLLQPPDHFPCYWDVLDGAFDTTNSDGLISQAPGSTALLKARLPEDSSDQFVYVNAKIDDENSEARLLVSYNDNGTSYYVVTIWRESGKWNMLLSDQAGTEIVRTRQFKTFPGTIREGFLQVCIVAGHLAAVFYGLDESDGQTKQVICLTASVSLPLGKRVGLAGDTDVRFRDFRYYTQPVATASVSSVQANPLLCAECQDCECSCKNADVMLLTDTTGSMGPYIATIQSLFTSLRARFDSPTCQWAVVEYKDFYDGGDFASEGWHVAQGFTFTFDNVLAAVNALSAGGGGDFPEQGFAALKNAGEQWSGLGGRSGSEIKRVIIWAGDAPSWNDGANGQPYPSRADTISALQSAGIKVFALNLAGAGSGLDGSAGNDNDPNQATQITGLTGGQIFSGLDANSLLDIEAALCAALSG